MDPIASQRTLQLSPALRATIIDHARREAPRECCGIVAGRDGALTDVFPLTNVAPGNRLYEIDPVQLLELEFTTLPARSLAIAAIYHSHPATPAYPSLTDRAQAFWPEIIYLICSLADPEVPNIRGFLLDDGEVNEVVLLQENLGYVV